MWSSVGLQLLFQISLIPTNTDSHNHPTFAGLKSPDMETQKNCYFKYCAENRDLAGMVWVLYLGTHDFLIY